MHVLPYRKSFSGLRTSDIYRATASICHITPTYVQNPYILLCV